MKIIVSGLAGVLLGADKGSIRYKHQFRLFISGYCVKVIIFLLKINICWGLWAVRMPLLKSE
jgi:hypothetical protein